MKTKEIWQTTNQQPWVEALASGLITAKTRTSYPMAPIGSIVFLHSSKSRIWPHWKGLRWANSMNPSDWDRGMIVAVAEIKEIGDYSLLSKKETKFWDVYDPKDGTFLYNSVADWVIRFKNICRLKNPVAAKGMLSPFARAKPETVNAVISANPALAKYLS